MLTYTRNTRIEWGDCDPAGIVFYPRYFAMFDSCTTALFSQALGMSKYQFTRHYEFHGYPMVDTRARFLKPTKFGDDVVIETKVAEFRRSSFDVQHRLTLDGELCVECFDTRVWVERAIPTDPEKIQSKPIPQGGDREVRRVRLTGAIERPMPEPQTRHPDHRRVRRHRRGAGGRVRRQRPRAGAGGAARAAAQGAGRRDRGARPRAAAGHRDRSRRSADAAARIEDELREAGLEPQFVVNNAGFGLLGPAASLDRDEQLAMIDLNVRVLTDLSLRFVDSLARHRAASSTSPRSRASCRDRAWRSITPPRPMCCRSARRCTASSTPKGVRVTALCPGPVETEFQARAGIPRGLLPALPRALGRARRARGLRRPDARPARGGAGLRQQGGGAAAAAAAARCRAAGWCARVAQPRMHRASSVAGRPRRSRPRQSARAIPWPRRAHCSTGTGPHTSIMYS